MAGLHDLGMLDHISQLERQKAGDKWTAKGRREGGGKNRGRRVRVGQRDRRQIVINKCGPGRQCGTMLINREN